MPIKRTKAQRRSEASVIAKKWPKAARNGDSLNRLGKSGSGRLIGKPKQGGAVNPK